VIRELEQGLDVGVVIRCALALVGVALFFTNIDSYGFQSWGFPPPTRLVMAFAGVAGLITFLQPQRRTPLLVSPVAFWALGFFALTTAWAIFMVDRPAANQDLKDRFRSLAFLLAFLIIFAEPLARKVAVWGIAAATVFGAAMNVAEMLTLVTFSTQTELGRTVGRSAAFYINPNAAGLAIALGLAIAAEQLPKMLRVPLLVIGAIGVAATFSRGSMICLGIVFLWLLSRRALGTFWTVATAVFALVTFILAMQYAQTHDLLNDNTAARLQLAHDDSGRMYLAQRAWQMFLSSPLVGHGIGSTRTIEEGIGAHNMYVTWAADNGLLGLLAFPALGLALYLSNRSAACFTLTLLVAGFFSHNLFDDPPPILVIALAALGATPSQAPARKPAVLPQRMTADA
jgi:O-antigen ligase